MKSLIFVCTILCCLTVSAREWKDAQDKRNNVDGAFIAIINQRVILEKSDKSVVFKRLDSLAKEDQVLAESVEFFRDWKELHQSAKGATDANNKRLQKESLDAFAKKFQNQKVCVQYSVIEIKEKKGKHELSAGDSAFLTLGKGKPKKCIIDIPQTDVTAVDNRSTFTCTGRLAFASKPKAQKGDWPLTDGPEKITLHTPSFTIETPAKIIKLNSQLKRNGEEKHQESGLSLPDQIRTETDSLLKRKADDNREAIEKAKREAAEDKSM